MGKRTGWFVVLILLGESPTICKRSWMIFRQKQNKITRAFIKWITDVENDLHSKLIGFAHATQTTQTIFRFPFLLFGFHTHGAPYKDSLDFVWPAKFPLGHWKLQKSKQTMKASAHINRTWTDKWRRRPNTERHNEVSHIDCNFIFIAAAVKKERKFHLVGVRTYLRTVMYTAKRQFNDERRRKSFFSLLQWQCALLNSKTN